nr:hypothetical protein CFP56_21069 [Quercus suber]
MHFRSLAVVGLLAHTAIAGEQPHRRKVTEGYFYQKRGVSGSQGLGAPTAYSTGSRAPPAEGPPPSDEFRSTLFQYAPTTTSGPQDSARESILTASATLSSTPSSVPIVNTSSGPATIPPFPFSTGSFTGTPVFVNSTYLATHTPSNLPPSYATGSGIGLNRTSAAPLCTGQTLNVLSASLDFWYAETYTYVASIFFVQSDANGTGSSWSVLTPTTSFDVASALASSCTSSLVWNPTYTTSLYTSSCFATPGPVAASTTVITQTAYKPFSVTTGTGDLPNVATQPTPAAITVASQTSGYSAGVPFVFFSAYEIMSKSPHTYRNGSVGCAETTQRFDMPAPFSFEYQGADANGSLEVGADVVGDVNPAFLELYSIDAAAGSWVAAPTVVVVVDKVLAAQSVLAGQTQQTAVSLILPSPTLPSFTTPVASSTQSNGAISPDVTSAADVASSDAGGLIVPTAAPTTTSVRSTSTTKPSDQNPSQSSKPFVAHLESSDITLHIPAPATQTLITTRIGGEIITATALSVAHEPSGRPASGQATHHETTATTQASPTNALEVLTAALSTDGLGSAILAGLGVSQPTALPSVVDNAPGTASAAQKAPRIVLGSQTFTANAATQFSLAPDMTLTAGGQVIMSGTTISLDSDAKTAVINGVTSTLSSPQVTPAPLITIGSTAYQGNAGSTFNIHGSQLTPGGTLVVSGTTISLAEDASSVVVDGTTKDLGATGGANAALATITAPAVLYIGGTAYAANGGTTYLVSGQQLTPGGSIILTTDGSEETISLNSAADGVVTIVDGTSVTSSLGTGPTAAPVLTIDGERFTAVNDGTTYVIEGQTLAPGEVETVTISGQSFIVSLSPHATEMQVLQMGADGQVTSTMVETLFPAPVAPTTVYMTVDTAATASQAVSAGSPAASSTGSPDALLNDAQIARRPLRGLVLAFGSLILAVWL